jgi:hypothetical protein
VIYIRFEPILSLDRLCFAIFWQFSTIPCRSHYTIILKLTFATSRPRVRIVMNPVTYIQLHIHMRSYRHSNGCNTALRLWVQLSAGNSLTNWVTRFQEDCFTDRREGLRHLVGQTQGKKQLRRPIRRKKNTIKMVLKELRCKDVDIMLLLLLFMFMSMSMG